MAMLMLSLLGAVSHFKRSLILERQREGITKVKTKGAYGSKTRSSQLLEKTKEMHGERMSLVNVAKEL